MPAGIVTGRPSTITSRWTWSWRTRFPITGDEPGVGRSGSAGRREAPTAPASSPAGVEGFDEARSAHGSIDPGARARGQHVVRSARLRPRRSMRKERDPPSDQNQTWCPRTRRFRSSCRRCTGRADEPRRAAGSRVAKRDRARCGERELERGGGDRSLCAAGRGHRHRSGKGQRPVSRPLYPEAGSAGPASADGGEHRRRGGGEDRRVASIRLRWMTGRLIRFRVLRRRAETSPAPRYWLRSELRFELGLRQVRLSIPPCRYLLCRGSLREGRQVAAIARARSASRRSVCGRGSRRPASERPTELPPGHGALRHRPSGGEPARRRRPRRLLQSVREDPRRLHDPPGPPDHACHQPRGEGECRSVGGRSRR